MTAPSIDVLGSLLVTVTNMKNQLNSFAAELELHLASAFFPPLPSMQPFIHNFYLEEKLTCYPGTRLYWSLVCLWP